MAVDPVTSVNTTVTILRTAGRGEGRSKSGEPHARQKRARSGFSSPHAGQDGTGGV
jgi:hypothetical protein